MLTVWRGYLPTATISQIEFLDFSCVGLELPWRDNQQDISCIPEGVYEYEVKYSVRAKRDVIWINGVEGRTSIQMHPGNYTRQILGCILPGDAIKHLDGDKVLDVSNSTATFDKLLRVIPKRGQIKFTSLKV